MYPYSLGIGDPTIAIGPAEIVSVIGFPFGLASGGCFAIWASGFVASDPAIDYEQRPVFLIDCRSRPGQSGSAVVAHRAGGTVRTEEGVHVGGGEMTRFLGVYSGRVNSQSDLGLVWKAECVQELVQSIE